MDRLFIYLQKAGHKLNFWCYVLQVTVYIFRIFRIGVNWVDMHLLSDRVHLEELKKLGLLTGDVSEMMKVRLGALFCPHGLGHMMGLDTHDVGGFLEVHLFTF